MREKVLVPAHFAAEIATRSATLDVDIIPYGKNGTPERDAAGATAFFRWWLTAAEGDAVIEQHPTLRWIHSGSAGIDHILTEKFLSAAITLTNSSGVHAPSIAEWVVGLMLHVEKDFSGIIAQQQQRLFEKVERDELAGRRVVVIGGGHIASEIARRLRPFGVRLVCVRRSAAPHRDFDETHPVDSLMSQAARCDWLIVAVPLSAATRRLVSAEVIAALPPHARIVNVARGEIVDQQALTAALVERRIAGAILDVFEEEPLPADDPLWSAPGTIVLPHTTWRSPRVKERQLDLFVENLRRFVAGESLLNVVDVSRGY